MCTCSRWFVLLLLLHYAGLPREQCTLAYQKHESRLLLLPPPLLLLLLLPSPTLLRRGPFWSDADVQRGAARCSNINVFCVKKSALPLASSAGAAKTD